MRGSLRGAYREAGIPYADGEQGVWSGLKAVFGVLGQWIAWGIGAQIFFALVLGAFALAFLALGWLLSGLAGG